MTSPTPASLGAAPSLPLSKPQPGTIPVVHLQPVLAAHNACGLAASYLEHGNVKAARRKLVQALACVNEVTAQGGAA